MTITVNCSLYFSVCERLIARVFVDRPCDCDTERGRQHCIAQKKKNRNKTKADTTNILRWKESFRDLETASAVMSSHAASMAARRVICVRVWRLYTYSILHLCAEKKKSSMGLRNGEYGERNSISICPLADDDGN